MSFAAHYFTKYANLSPLIETPPETDLKISIVIPCFNEPDIILTLNSLYQCKHPNSSVEVIIVINSSEKASENITNQNKKSFDEVMHWILEHSSKKIQYFCLFINNLPHKDAGVGLARKIGMDEALRRFNQLDKPNGIIVGFDADSLCETNYLVEIEKLFYSYPKANACSIYYEHPIEGADFEPSVYERIIQYELYLRYYRQALKFIGFPYAYHTIGSSFAVRADVYAKQGGMNKKKAGEDFYFLHKVIPLGNFLDLNTTRVIPSPRSSDRVPFGTGAAIQKLLDDANPDYLTYQFDVFLELKHFFDGRFLFFKNNSTNSLNLSKIIEEFLKNNDFEKELIKINENSPNTKIFNKRFFDWFDAFRILKFLNFAHETYFQKKSVYSESKKLLTAIGVTVTNINIKEMLFLYRNIDRDPNFSIYDIKKNIL